MCPNCCPGPEHRRYIKVHHQLGHTTDRHNPKNKKINFTNQKELLIAGAFLLSWLTAFSVWQCEPAPGESGLQCQNTGCLMD
jgi:hypothetical protein